MERAMLGLLGYPLSHSFSPAYFKKKFERLALDIEYRPFEIKDVANFDVLWNEASLKGFNITLPHKQHIIPYLDQLSPDAQAIGAVNTVVLKEGKRLGFNTDWLGFKESLGDVGSIKNALVLGSGGSSRAIQYALSQMGLYVFTAGRNKSQVDFEYQDIPIEIFDDALLVVNCTPLGMFPNIEDCPQLPYHVLNENHYCFDLVYNPEETLFLKKAKAQGSRVKNGQDMLLLQAEKSWELWCNFHPQLNSK